MNSFSRMVTNSKLLLTAGDTSMSGVMDDDDLLNLVLARIKDLKLVVAASVVSKRWRATVSARSYIDELRSRCSTPVLGFISVFKRLDSICVCFASLPGISGTLELAASQVEATFQGHISSRHEPVLCCLYDKIVMRQEIHGGRYALRDLRDATPSSIVPPTDMAVPAWEGIPSRTTGSFLVIGNEFAFFNEFQQAPQLGESGLSVRVSQFISGSWHTTASPIFDVRYPDLLYNRPYALVVDKTMFMMYVHGVIIAFKFETRQYSLIKLPDVFECLLETDYRVARYGVKGLCIVRVRGPELIQWRLDVATEKKPWRLHKTIWLPDIMHVKIGKSYWEQVLHPTQNFYAIKIMSAGENGESAVLTFGFSSWFYYVNFVHGTSMEVKNSIDQDLLESVFPVKLAWPGFLMEN